MALDIRSNFMVIWSQQTIMLLVFEGKGSLEGTLNGSISAGHNHSLEPALTFNPHQSTI